jgi:hypothetical protein
VRLQKSKGDIAVTCLEVRNFGKLVAGEVRHNFF